MAETKSDFDLKLDPEKRDSAWYEELFCRQLANKNDFSEVSRPYLSEEYGLDIFGVVPAKINACDLYAFRNNRRIVRF